MTQPFSGGLKVAIYIFTVCFIYIFAVTFAPMSDAGLEHSKTVIGFLMGTVFSCLLNYYWGSSSKRNNDKNPIDIVIPDKSICTDIRQIETVNKVTNIDKINVEKVSKNTT